MGGTNTLPPPGGSSSSGGGVRHFLSHSSYYFTLLIHGVLCLTILSVLLLLVVAAVQCTPDKLAQHVVGEPESFTLLRDTVCGHSAEVRAWTITMLSLAAIMSGAMVGLSSKRCCRLTLPLGSSVRLAAAFLVATSYTLSNALLSVTLYTSLSSSGEELRFIHYACIPLLCSSFLVFTTVTVSIAQRLISRRSARYGLINAAQPVRTSLCVRIRDAMRGLLSRSQAKAGERKRRNSRPDLEEGSDERPQVNGNKDDLPVNARRSRMHSPSSTAGNALSSPLHRSQLAGSPHGLSSSEMRSIPSFAVPCLPRTARIDPRTGDRIATTCCSDCPTLPGVSAAAINVQWPVDTAMYAMQVKIRDHLLSLPIDPSPAHSDHLSPFNQSARPNLKLNTSASPLSAQAPNSGGMNSAGSQVSSASVGAPVAAADVESGMLENSPLSSGGSNAASLAYMLVYGPSPVHPIVCELCRDSFQSHQLFHVLPICGHAFHEGCLGPYLKQRRDCPRCKMEVWNEELKMIMVGAGVWIDSPGGGTDASSVSKSIPEANEELLVELAESATPLAFGSLDSGGLRSGGSVGSANSSGNGGGRKDEFVFGTSGPMADVKLSPAAYVNETADGEITSIPLGGMGVIGLSHDHHLDGSPKQRVGVAASSKTSVKGTSPTVCSPPPSSISGSTTTSHLTSPYSSTTAVPISNPAHPSKPSDQHQLNHDPPAHPYLIQRVQ